MEYIATQAQFIILPIVLLAFVAFTVLAFILVNKFDSEGWFWSGILGAIFSVIMIIATAITFSPYDAKYFGVYATSGTIETVTASIDASGQYTYIDYVVTLEDDPTLYVLSDPRVVGTEGQDVDLTCSIAYVPYSADYITCNIG
jgi:hypothetical protein